MPTHDIVHFRNENTYPVVRGGSSDNSSLFIGSGAEDWVTKKRVETKTTKNVERRVQRQVILLFSMFLKKLFDKIPLIGTKLVAYYKVFLYY